MMDKHVTVIGGGVAGLSTALNLAESGIEVAVIERSVFMGGHAANFTCKATDACVKCGACVVETLLGKAVRHKYIHLETACRVERVQAADRVTLAVNRHPTFIDPAACDNCGRCHAVCPQNSILRGTSPYQSPFYALDPKDCLMSRGEPCTVCRDACPQDAIHLDEAAAREERRTDALVLATGFKPFDPRDMPYGYGKFPNVVTNLELEKMLRRTGRLVRLSDQTPPASLAFIQCVGSRDARLGHLWCSRVCCGSALRMARLLKKRQPEIEITVFYIDIQSAGRDFETFYNAARQEIAFQRSIPGDIFENTDHTLNVTYADDADHTSREASFDMVVLSVGMLPNTDAIEFSQGVDLEPTVDGFLSCPGRGLNGIFTTGSASGPMGIAESVASAGLTANTVLSYLNMKTE